MGELVKIRDAAKQAGQQVSQEIDRALDDLLSDRPLAAAGGPNPGNQTSKQPGGNSNSGANQSGKQPESGGKQPEGNEPSSSNDVPDGSENINITFGSNAVKKFRSHAERIRTNANIHGFDIPSGGLKKPEVQNAMKDYMNFIIKNGETKIGAYKPTGGGDVNALWTKYDNSIVIRRSNGEFITFLDASKGGQALNSPFVNP